MKARRENIKETIDDLVGKFLYYDRKEDEDLPRGEIEAAIKAGEISPAEIVDLFRHHLREGLGIAGEARAETMYRVWTYYQPAEDVEASSVLDAVRKYEVQHPGILQRTWFIRPRGSQQVQVYTGDPEFGSLRREGTFAAEAVMG